MIHTLMEQIKKDLPVIKTCLEQYGQYSVEEYIHTIHHKTSRTEEIQSSHDVKEAVFDYLKLILGENSAGETAELIEKQKLLLTANHHEIEFCVQSIQGNMLYEQLLQNQGFTKGIIPIFSGTTVNMSNRNYPRGMLIYNTLPMTDMVKIPIFKNKDHNSLIAVCKPFTKEMIMNAKETVAKEKRNKNISKEISDAAIELLETKFMTDDVFACDRYADQAVLINRALGHMMYANKNNEFIYIEIEEIARRLIEKDLEEKKQLGYAILFYKELRNRIIENLKHKTGCWSTSGGTHFFWGIDHNTRRFPLLLQERKGETELTGIDMSGLKHTYEYTPESIIHLLRARKIIPGLMLTFFQLYMIRDFTMLGGCFQSDYLRQMQLGIIQSLEEIGGFSKEIEFIKNKKSYYLSGPMFILGGQSGSHYPMSTVELIQEGGITIEKLQDYMNISMNRAHEIGIYNFYIDLVCQKERLPDWWKILSEGL